MSDREAAPLDRITAYHDATKHHFDRFARSLGYLDWAAQPKPFRAFAGARVAPLYPRPDADLPTPAPGTTERLPFGLPALGFLLRHALGLSAWKAFRGNRWSLRVNPSSGNLHPTEAYVITRGHVWHYGPDRHALEERCTFAAEAWDMLFADPSAATSAPAESACLVILTSIHWREAWKYGERAFRYCQHDIGHAIAALRVAAAQCGWTAALDDDWTHEQLATATGTDRDEDFVEAEREEPACALLLSADSTARLESGGLPSFVEAVQRGTWTGQASQLSEDHVQWTFIDEVATASRVSQVGLVGNAGVTSDRGWTPALVLQRRSAVAFDARTAISRDTFIAMLSGVMPGAGAPFDVLPWSPHIHLLLFVHRVDGLEPGIYLLPRSDDGEGRLRAAITRAFTWERVATSVPLFALATGDCRRLAQRLSCDQDIAADGCFSLGMLAEFDHGLRDAGPSFYRRLFWESGVIGQQLYLEAESAGVRGTGIGCFYDDGVHDVLGITDHAVQSLYHFTIGGAVEDGRLTTEPGYEWEARQRE